MPTPVLLINYHQVIPGLYVGNAAAARNPPPDVRRVVNCAFELGNLANVPPDQYWKIPLRDSGDPADQATFAHQLGGVFRFLDAVSLRQSPVLIHCQQGISRSCSIALAYLLYHGLVPSIPAGVQFLVRTRPIAFYGCGSPTTPGTELVYGKALYDTFG